MSCHIRTTTKAIESGENGHAFANSGWSKKETEVLVMSNSDTNDSSWSGRLSTAPDPMDDVNMQVDALPTEMISSNAKGSKNRLPEDQLRTLVSTMLQASSEELWESRVINATSSTSDSDTVWRGLCYNTLSVLTAALDVTDLNRNVLTNLKRDHIYRLIDGCDEKERDDMRNGVRKGIVDGNWATLIDHRTWPSALLDYY
jgi:hypothetical protein